MYIAIKLSENYNRNNVIITLWVNCIFMPVDRGCLDFDLLCKFLSARCMS